MRAALWVLVFALITPLAARADDYGPKRDVAAIRHDLPILLLLDASTRIERVVIEGDNARAEVHSGDEHEAFFLHKRYGRWWYAGMYGVISYDEPSPLPCAPKPCTTYVRGDTTLTPASVFRGDIPLDFSPHGGVTNDDYRIAFWFATHNWSQDAKIKDFVARAPTEAESWANSPGGNSYFFFSGTVDSKDPIRFQSGSKIDVWFPFVLDPSLRYSLTVAAPNVMSLGPVEGTLKDNTLHFVLPAFTAPPGAELMGEIDSD